MIGQELQPFGSIEEAVKVLLEARFAQLAVPGHIRTSFNGVEDHLPFVGLEKIGGQRDRFEDRPVVDLDVFAGTRAEAETFAELIDAFLLGGGRRLLVGDRVMVIDDVISVATPRPLPWDDTRVRRYGLTLGFVLRRAGGLGSGSEVPLDLVPQYQRVIVGKGPPEDGVGQVGWLYIDSVSGDWYELQEAP